MTRVRPRPVGVLALMITALLCLSFLPIGAEAQQADGRAASEQRTTSVAVTTAVSDSAGVVKSAAGVSPQVARTIRAIRWALSNARYPTRTCLLFVRNAFQVKRKFGTAHSAWTHAKYRHRAAIAAIAGIPAGVPVFTQGASPSGHVVLSLGNGWVRSTDWPRDGMVGTVKLTTLLKKWRHRYLGWSEDLNGVRVWHR
jgi:hypothetical protein